MEEIIKAMKAASKSQNYMKDVLDIYVKHLNIPLGYAFLKARNNFESSKEGDDKNLSLGMPVQPQEDDECDVQLENEEWKLPPFTTHG